MEMKICPNCKIEKELVEFYNDKGRKDKKSYFCKKCDNIRNNKGYAKYPNKKKEYSILHKDKIKQYRNSYKERRNQLLTNQRKTNPLERIKHAIRVGIQRSFKSKYFEKSLPSIKILGCEYDKFLTHLIHTFERIYEIPFKEEYSKHLELDHIVPLTTAKIEEDLYRLNHYTNFQWIYWEHNAEKFNKKDYVIPKLPEVLTIRRKKSKAEKSDCQKDQQDACPNGSIHPLNSHNEDLTR